MSDKTIKKKAVPKAASSIDLGVEITTIAKYVASMAEDIEQFEQGNKAAGLRIRKACKAIGQSSQLIRAEIKTRILSEM